MDKIIIPNTREEAQFMVLRLKRMKTSGYR